MAPSNIELARSIYEDWENGDYSSSDWAHPEIEFVIVGGPTPGRWTGLTGMAEGFRSWLNAWQDYRVDVQEYRELDSARVLILGHLSGRGRASGLDLAQMGAKALNLLHFCEGKVTRVVLYFDHERGLADLGLRSEEGAAGR